MITFKHQRRSSAPETPIAAIILTLAALLAIGPEAQAQTRPFIAVRAYPAGAVAAAGASLGWSGRTDGRRTGKPLQFEAGIWAGTNLTRRRDWGEHDDERGGGFGGGAELAWFPCGHYGGWFTGVRASVWRMEIEWRDDPQTPLGPARVGETNILVVQPTARGGYRFGFGSRLRLDAEAALGAEINVATDGEEVGQGAIGLVGLRFVF